MSNSNAGNSSGCQQRDPCLPMAARVVENRPEVPGVVTLSLRLEDAQQRAQFRFRYGQFTMLCLPGTGEIPLSIMDQKQGLILHTLRGVGRVSNALLQLQPGALLGLRGPYGSHWPLTQAKGRDVVFITAGLGCAPVVAAIRQVVEQSAHYRRIVILQGVKYRHDLLWQAQYQAWRAVPDCQVLLAASEERPVASSQWVYGLVTSLLEQARFDADNCLVMMCGPEPMLRVAMQGLRQRGVAPEHCYLSLERNMQCGIGHCGHCQMGEPFLCRQGPVFTWPQIRRWLEIRGI